MTKKERIAELERKVAELEARAPYFVYPYWSVIPPYQQWWPYYGTTTVSDTGNVTYIGAAS